jgi:hypothetical protein
LPCLQMGREMIGNLFGVRKMGFSWWLFERRRLLTGKPKYTFRPFIYIAKYSYARMILGAGHPTKEIESMTLNLDNL